MPPAEAAKIPCPTPAHLQAELATLAAIMEPGETEDSWDKIERAIIRFAAVVRGGGYKHGEAFIRGIGNKGLGLGIVDCMLSDRGRLSGAATELLQTFAPRLGHHFHSLVHLYLPPLIRLLARPNKVYIKRAEKCLFTIISNCPLPSIVLHLRNGLDEKSDQCKRIAAVAVERAMTEWDPARWQEKDLEVLELCVRKMATDKDAQVRKTGKTVWASFQEIWPERVDDFVGPLTPTVRRYLDLPPAEGGPSRPKPVSRLNLGRTGGAAPSHPAHPPVHAAGPSRLHLSSGPEKEKDGRRVPSATSSAYRTRHEPVESRSTSDHGRSRAMDPLPRTDAGSRVTRSASSHTIPHMSSSSSLGSASGRSASALSSKPIRPTPQPSAPEPSATTRRLGLPHRTVRPADVDEDDRRARPAAQGVPPRSTTRRIVTTPTPAVTTASASAPSSVVHGSSHPSSAPSDTPRNTSDPARSASRVRERVTEIERRASEHGTTPTHPTPNRDLQLAAGIPVPHDTPVPTKPQASNFSPSLSMLLGRNKAGGDIDVTLADLSMDPSSVDSPVPPRFSGLPPARQVSAPLPAPSTTSRQAEGTPAESTAAATPADTRRISPLPRRVSEGPVETPSPPRSKKRKGCEIEQVLETNPAPLFSVDDTPCKPTAPTATPLISFADSPARPFTFRSAPVRPRESIFSALMGLAMDAPAPVAESLSAESIEEEDEDDEADVTVRMVPVETPHGELVDVQDEAADTTAVFVPHSVTEEPEHVEERVEAPAHLVEEPVEEPVAEPVEETVAELAAETPQKDEPTPVRTATPEPPKDIPVPSTPLPEVLAEFDTLTESENDDDDVTDMEHTVVLERDEPAAVVVPAVVAPVVTHHGQERVTMRERTFISTPGGGVFFQEREMVVESVESEAIAAPASTLTIEEMPAEGAEAKETVEEAPTVEASSATELLIDTSDEAPTPEKTTELDDMKEAFEEQKSVDLLKISTGSTASSAVDPDAKPKTRPISAAERRPKLGRRGLETPVEKKSFRPVSRAKAAPAPARVATRAPVSATTSGASTGASTPATDAPMLASSSSSTTAAPKAARPARKPAAPALVTASKPAPPVSATAAPKMTKTTGSSLFKPTAATAARAAATQAATSALAEAKEKEAKELLEPKEPRPVARTVSQTHARAAAPAKARSATAAFGSTAASRAREAAALPPIKRQRLKLTAPQESFRPGRTANKSKASVLGAGSGPSARQRRPIRATKGKEATNETFPLDGPGLRASLSKQGDEEKGNGESEGKGNAAGDSTSPVPVARSATLEVPIADDHDAVPRTPGSSGFAPGCLSPASSRHTSYTSHSDVSCGSRPSPSKLKMAPPRPLSPVLTPTHSANVSAISSSGQAALVAPVADSPAVMHARRVSGIPASLKKTIAEEAARRKAAQLAGSPPSTGALAMLVDDEMDTPPGPRTRQRTALRRAERVEEDEENCEDGAVWANRHDVATPTSKAASLLTKLSDERDRRALAPRDANSQREE